jgi:hypothetical protein
MNFKLNTPQIGRILAVIFLCSLFTVGTAFAGGQMIVKPVVELGWQRDTNFHKADTNTQTIDTYYIKPGITFGYQAPKTSVSFNFWLNNLNYDDQDTVAAGQLKADDFDYTEYQATFGAKTQVADRLQVGLDNMYKNTRDPASADANANTTDRFKYSINKFTPWINYRFGEKYGLGLKYTNNMTDYSDDGAGEGEDTIENRGAFTLYYYFTPKTSFDLDYQVWNRDYDKTSSEYTSNQVMVNVKHQINYLTLGAGAGYQMRDFDNAVTNGDIETFTWKLSLMGQNAKDGSSIPRSSMYLALGGNLNDSGAGNTYYQATRLDAKFTYLLMEKLNCTLAAWVANSDYETSTREDDKWFLSGALDYLINDYLTIGIEGGMEQRDSNAAGKDYENEYVMLNISAGYDFGSK